MTPVLIVIALLLAALMALTYRGVFLLSDLSNKIALLTSDVTDLQTDVATALGNAATPADLEALDAAHTNLQAVIASLTPTS